MKDVIQYNYQASSPEDAANVADALRQLEGCIDAQSYGWSANAHFAMDEPISPEALPEGCRIVPYSVVEFIQRTGAVRKVIGEEK